MTFIMHEVELYEYKRTKKKTYDASAACPKFTLNQNTKRSSV